MDCARLRATLGIFVMLCAASTEAGELELFVENRLGGDSNVLRRSEQSVTGEVADGFWEFAPGVGVRDETGELRYRGRYQSAHELYFDTSGIDGWDHSASGGLDWDATPRDRVEVDGAFYSTRNLREESSNSGLGGDLVFQPSDRQRTRRSKASFDYTRYLSPRWSARIGYDFDDLDFSRRDISDTRAHTASTGFTYVVDPKTSVGLSVTGRLRHSRLNQDVNLGPLLGDLNEVRSRSTTADVSVSFARQLTETLSFSAQVGPSIVRTDQDQVLSSSLGILRATTTDSRDVSVFAAVSVDKEWERGSAGVAYSRYESGGGGNVSSTIVDEVSVNGVYRPARHWTLDLYASWNRREQLVDDIGFGGDNKITQYRVRGLVVRQLGERFSIRAFVQYRFQDQETRTSDVDVEIVSGFLGLRYTFDPFIF